MTNEQALARDIFVRVDHPTLGETKMPGFPVKFSDAAVDISIPVPLLGQHTEEVLSKILGLPNSDIEELHKDGVI